LAIVLLLAACGAEPTPEDRVRAFIDQVAESAEERDWQSFEDYVAKDYADDRGLTRKDVLALVARYLLANQRIYILKRVAAIRIDDPPHAHAVIYAAMAGQPFPGPEDLAGIDADVYRFEVVLTAAADGALHLTRGDWRRVGPESFLIGR
jgi:hypothetical protein